jgi:hypothetical protein
VVGFAKGLYSDTTVPKFNIDIASNNASFQYPDLPKSVRNIVIDTKIVNETRILNDTYIILISYHLRSIRMFLMRRQNFKYYTKCVY